MEQSEKIALNYFQVYEDKVYFINPNTEQLCVYDPATNKTEIVFTQRVARFIIYEDVFYILKLYGGDYQLAKVNSKMEETILEDMIVDDIDNICTIADNSIYISSYADGFQKYEIETGKNIKLFDNYVYDFQKYGKTILTDASYRNGIYLLAAFDDGNNKAALTNKSASSLCIYNNIIYFLGKNAIYSLELGKEEILKLDDASAGDDISLIDNKIFYRNINKKQYMYQDLDTKEKIALLDIGSESDCNILGYDNENIYFIETVFHKQRKEIKIYRVKLDTMKSDMCLTIEGSEKMTVFFSNGYIGIYDTILTIYNPDLEIEDEIKL